MEAVERGEGERKLQLGARPAGVEMATSWRLLSAPNIIQGTVTLISALTARTCARFRIFGTCARRNLDRNNRGDC